MKLSKKIAIGLAIGFVLGGAIHFFKESNTSSLVATGNFLLTTSDVIGQIFLRLLSMLIIPLVFASITSSVANLGDVRKLKKIGVTTLVYYLITTFLAVIIGIVLVNAIKPGIGADIGLSKKIMVDLDAHKSRSILDTIIHIVPSNIIAALARSDILQIVFFGILLGIALGMMKKKYNLLLDILNEVNEAIIVIITWVLNVLPIGVCFLMARAIGNAGLDVIKPLAKYMATVLTGLGLHALITLPLILWVFGKMNPLKAFKGIEEAVATAFSTASSSATLPVTIRCVTQNLGVSQKIADFVLPIGATVNMDGTALYEAVAAIFIAQAYGIHLTLAQQVVIVITATLAAIGAAGIPQAGLFTMVIVLRTVGLPLEGIAVILAVDNILDMCRTSVNVLGDAFGSIVVAHITGEGKTLGTKQGDISDLPSSIGDVAAE